MNYSHSIKELSNIINQNKEINIELNKLIENKTNHFQKDFLEQIKKLESSLKKMKSEYKNIILESKQIEKSLNDGKGIIEPEDFNDYISSDSKKMNIKELAYKMALQKPVVEWKSIISKKIQSKFLPLESWTDQKIYEVLSNTIEFPSNKDIFSKLPKSYKPKSLPKKRDDVIKKIIDHVNQTRSGYIVDKI
jgi:hypothetical protein